MASYSPLAVKVFGNKRIRTWLKMALMRSLVLSRSCFNLHISVPGPWLLKRLNRVHMRVLRRIARCINGVDTDGVGQPHQSNRAVRQMLGEPSIDCIDARARLKYWRRVMKSGPPMLRALIWNSGRPTKWALQVRKDLEALACQVPGQLTPEELSRTAINSTDAQWDTVVRELFWDTSCVDPERHVDTITSSSITCSECIGTSGETRQFIVGQRAPVPSTLRNMVTGIQCAFSQMMTVYAVCVVRTSGRGYDFWITYQIREERTAEMCQWWER